VIEDVCKVAAAPQQEDLGIVGQVPEIKQLHRPERWQHVVWYEYM
jgi:hypothetical protein